MKRIASILIGIVLLCTLAACTSGAESSEPAASEADMSGENMEEANAVEANKEGENTEEAAVEETGTGEQKQRKRRMIPAPTSRRAAPTFSSLISPCRKMWILQGWMRSRAPASL